MALSNNFAQYLSKKLSGLSSHNINKTGSLTFGSLTSVNKYLSVFENSASDISKIDYDAILKALESGSVEGLEDESTQSIAAMMNEILAIQEANAAIDTSSDGEIEASELEAFVKDIAGADGNAEDLSIDDINAFFDKMGIDLNATVETAIADALKENDSEQVEDIEKEKELQEAQQPSSASSGGNVGGSPSGGGVSPSSSNFNSSKTSNNTKAETPEEIQAKIDEKNDEIKGVEEDAEAKIAEEEKAKEEAMKSAGISDEEYEKYQKQEEQYEKDIKSKEEEISKKDDEIADYNSTIDSNKGYIASLETQIKDNESRKSSLNKDDENYSSKSSEIDSKIANLTAEKEKIDAENQELEKKVQQAEADKVKLEEEKTGLETKKAELLSQTLNASSGFGKGITDTSADSKKSEIAKFDENIKQIKSDKETKVSSLKTEVQDLQVQLKDAQAAEERSAFIKDNRAVNGLGLTGEELVEVAKQMLNKYGSSKGYCATGVSRTFQMAYGLNLHGNGCDWDTNMDNLVKQGAFEEVTGDYATSADLANLPAGAVVCWEATGGSSGGAKYGHVTIADGKGGEISDHYAANIYKTIGGRSDQYRVYIPIT